MRSLLPATLFPLVCLTLGAQTTGQFAGKVTTKDGKPIPGAIVIIKRIDINWTKQLKVSANGSFLQVGLDPKEYDLTVTAEGFVAHPPERVRIPLGARLDKPIFLLTPQEAVAAGTATQRPADVAVNAAADAFNQGVAFYNSNPPQYTEALPKFETAHAAIKDAIEKAKEEKDKEESRKQLVSVERVLGITQYEVGKQDEARKSELWTKAEPFLAGALARNPKDQRILTYLVDIYKLKGDAQAAATHQATLDGMLGPRPELAYNSAVEAFNAGKNAEAKEFLLKAIQIDAKYPKSYYLLGMVEFGLNNLKGTKDAFLKYLELAPTGEKAAEVKEMLADASLKKIK